MSAIASITVADSDDEQTVADAPVLEKGDLGAPGAKGERGASIYDVDFDPQTGELIFYFTD